MKRLVRKSSSDVKVLESLKQLTDEEGFLTNVINFTEKTCYDFVNGDVEENEMGIKELVEIVSNKINNDFMDYIKLYISSKLPELGDVSQDDSNSFLKYIIDKYTNDIYDVCDRINDEWEEEYKY